jgi:endonuclease G
VSRDKSVFASDQSLPYQGVTDSDYDNTGFDRGHLKPAEDSPDQAAMDESHLMTNVAPEYPNFNRQTWRTLEQAINELVDATGGKAEVVTGPLYLDANGKPLPPDQIATMGSGKRKVAVPTHIFKAVRLTKPDGSITEFAFSVPNDPNSPTTRDEIGKRLADSRVSIDQLESTLGQDLFGDANPELESQANPTVTFPHAGHFHAASLLWPQGTEELNPYLRSSAWKDSYPDWFKEDLKNYGIQLA